LDIGCFELYTRIPSSPQSETVGVLVEPNISTGPLCLAHRQRDGALNEHGPFRTFVALVDHAVWIPKRAIEMRLPQLLPIMVVIRLSWADCVRMRRHSGTIHFLMG